MVVGIQTKPEPTCPECGTKMILRRPRRNQSWKPFWGCTCFPNCKGRRGIGSDGKAIIDEIDREVCHRE